VQLEANDAANRARDDFDQAKKDLLPEVPPLSSD